MAAQPYAKSLLDNYQQYHPHLIQVGSKAGIMHISMVFNWVQIKEFLKPPGIQLRDVAGVLWTVTQSSMPTPWLCNVIIKTSLDGTDELQSLTLPLMEWKIVSIPGLETDKQELTYIDQHVHHSLNSRVPSDFEPREIVLCVRKWSNVTSWRILPPREYVGMLRCGWRVQDLIRYAEFKLKED